MAPVVDYIATNWLALLSLGIALGSFWIAWSVKSLAHFAIVESQQQGGPKHDEYGRPTLTVSITNTGPGIAKNVRVRVKETFEGPRDGSHPNWWRRRSTTPVAERLGPNSTAYVQVPASGDNLDLVIVRWKDGGGNQATHPSPPPEFFVV